MQQANIMTRLLRVPWCYDRFLDVVGANAARRRFINAHVRARPGDKIIDIGCGPAQMLAWLPDVRYIGIDPSEDYIQAARRAHGSAGEFLVGDTGSLLADSRLSGADIVMCSGVLHHLEDHEVLSVVQFAHQALKPGGRFVSFEPCWVSQQGALSRWIMSHDRGKNIRTEEGYRNLLATEFHDIKTVVYMKAIRIPTVGIAIECAREQSLAERYPE